MFIAIWNMLPNIRKGNLTASLFTDAWKGIALAVFIAMTWNFLWDRKYAFWYARGNNIFVQYVGFVLVCSVGALANFFITKSLSESNAILYSGLIGVIFGSAIGITFNFIVTRLFVFKH